MERYVVNVMSRREFLQETAVTAVGLSLAGAAPAPNAAGR